MIDIQDEIKKYIAECLSKEDRKPVGMYGNWAYCIMKEKEYKEKQKNEDI